MFFNLTSSLLLVEITSKISLPSSIKTLSPFLTSFAKPLYEREATLLFPVIVFEVFKVRVSPF